MSECLMFGKRVVVSKSLRSKMPKQFHIVHPCVKRMKSIARSYVYWPLVDKHILDLVGKYTVSTSGEIWLESTAGFMITAWVYLVQDTCLLRWPSWWKYLPTCSWSAFEIVRNPSHDATNDDQSTTALGWNFSCTGLPSATVSDNCLQFAFRQFQVFCQRPTFKHFRFRITVHSQMFRHKRFWARDERNCYIIWKIFLRILRYTKLRPVYVYETLQLCQYRSCYMPTSGHSHYGIHS